MLTAQNIAYMPKVDLHRHLEGSIRPSTIYKLIETFGYYTQKPGLSEIISNMQVDGSEKTLSDFFAKLGTKFMLLCTKDKKSLKKFAYEACEDAALDGVVYLELRFCPSNYYKTPISAEEFIEGVYEGVKAAEKDFSIDTGLILSIKREESTEINWQMVNCAIKYFEKGIVHGVDLCGNEPLFPTRRYKELFTILHMNKIPITVHAGESNDLEQLSSIVEAVTLLHAQRIGHCTLAAKSRRILKMLNKNNIFMEVCPTSNIYTKIVDSYKNHPSRLFLHYGNAFSINTDDPITLNISLTNEYNRFMRYHHATPDTFKIMNLQSVFSAFQQSSKKVELKEKYLARFKQWEEIVKEEHEYTYNHSVFHTDQRNFNFAS
jgi:adenosine deaminase